MDVRIQEAVGKALKAAGAPNTVFAVEWPTDPSHGDYATNAALAAAKTLGKSPKALAEELAPAIAEALGSYAASVSVAGPGFINITLARDEFTSILGEVKTQGAAWGVSQEHAGKRIMVEYTDPNPFKEMHIGHLMSNVIGEAVARLIENSGAHTVRACYQGDVGPHVAKALWGLRDRAIAEPATADEIGSAYAHGSAAYEKSEKAKAEIDELNVAIYKDEDRELMELWRKGKDVSLAAFEEIYRVLGTKFDYYFFESEVAQTGMDEVVKNTPGVFTQSDGAVIYEGEKKGLHTLVFITSKGTPTYEAKEIGLAFAKEERWPSDESYILTAAEQIGHFKVVKAALLDVAPALGAKTHHIPHGFLRLTSGKMSSREGTIITARSLIQDVTEKVSEKNDDPLIAEQVAIAAIKYSILKQSAGSDIIFDFERSLSLEGDSGPYLQYAYVRAKTVLEKAGKGGTTNDAPHAPYLLERLIARFPSVAVRAERERLPHHMAQYLTLLAAEWNSFYAVERIIGGEYESYKLLIAEAFATTMKNGLTLLGIPVPERM